jgi:hypothetical protein
MKKAMRILLLLAVLMTMVTVGDLSAKKPGLICGTPDDPIPCSTFDNGTCIYTYNQAANCCYAHSGCLGYCC